MINLRRVRKLVESNNDLTLKESVVDKKKQLFIEGKDSSFKLKVNLNENNCDIVILDDENNSIEEYEAPMANSQELVDAISNALQLYDVIDEIAPEIKSTEVTNSDPVLDAPNKDEEENKETNGTAEELIVVATEPELELVAPEDIEEVIEVPDDQPVETNTDAEIIEDEETEEPIEEEFLGVSDEVRKDSAEKGLVPEDECLHTDELEDLEDTEASKFDVPDYLDKAIAELEIRKDDLEEENKVKLSNVINALKTEKFLIENIIKK